MEIVKLTLPSAYLTSAKNTHAIFDAIAKAQAPARFTQKFLEGLGFPSSSDRLIINVLKSLGFLSDTGEPTQRYHRYLDRGQSGFVLAEGIRAAYGDLFQINKDAQSMQTGEVKNKMKTLSQGQYSDSVLDKMSSTFTTLAKLADWKVSIPSSEDAVQVNSNESSAATSVNSQIEPSPIRKVGIGGLVYSLNLYLPESRDQAVYDALFRSIKEHLV